MLINELASDPANSSKLAALAEFLRRRAVDTAVEPEISTNSFIKLANSIGVSITKSQLKDMIGQPPLNNIIQDVTGSDSEDDPGVVVFRGGTQEQNKPVITKDMARLTVDTMAKRAAKKK